MEESRFVCKLCNKKLPCGKSLGGHMRSHVVAAANEARVEHNLKRISTHPLEEYVNVQSCYGLRENPRKTWRAVDSQERVCKQCGKGFQSLKALCGHMACHSDKDRTSFKDDLSWTSHSDTEVRTRSCKSKKVVDESEMDGQDQEEVAMCLMLLSTDSGNKNGVNSVVLETKREDIKLKDISTFDEMIPHMESSDSGYFLEEASFDGFGKSKGNEYESRKRQYTEMDNMKSKYECFNCKKTFKSYQALGGHRTCQSGKHVESKNNKGHVCPFCNRVFKNGQALGGHKRSHFIVGNSLVKPDLLDLNLPAPEAGKFFLS